MADQISGEIHYVQMGRINIVKMSIASRLIHRFGASPVKIWPLTFPVLAQSPTQWRSPQPKWTFSLAFWGRENEMLYTWNLSEASLFTAPDGTAQGARLRRPPSPSRMDSEHGCIISQQQMSCLGVAVSSYTLPFRVSDSGLPPSSHCVTPCPNNSSHLLLLQCPALPSW